MKKAAFAIFLLLFFAGAFRAGVWFNQRAAARNGHVGERKVLYYVDPMHPAYKSDKPGIAPDCGMQLVAVYADEGAAALAHTADSGMPAGTVSISPEKQQLIGVRVSRVEEAFGPHTLRLFGRVAPDEARVYKLNAGIEGYVQEVAEATTGSQVKKNQLLATFSAPNATMTIQTYILNLGAEDRFKKSAAEGSPEGQSVPAANANVQQRIQQLQNVGMSVLQMEEIKRTRQIPESIKILAPADGFVLARNVSPGQKFERGAEWYRIADLSRVWILADVFENDVQYLRPGVGAQVSLPNQKKTLAARVTDVLPQFDPATRTLKVRLELDNPGFAFRPDMFVNVELPIKLPPGISVPVDAVLDSGTKTTVFVDRGKGVFEPRKVETGWHFGNRVQIVKGLMAGEQVVVSGNFLIDSESRLTAAAAAVPSASSKDPACGMLVDEQRAKAAGNLVEYRGKTYLFCSDGCKRNFQNSPARYIDKAPAENLSQAKVKITRGGPNLIEAEQHHLHSQGHGHD
jgi:membrane fusion protein, copper/silver efflux system